MKTPKKGGPHKVKLKKDDQVTVLAGEDKGQSGRILAIVDNGKRAVVEGVNIIHRHTKPNAENPNGGIVKKEAPIHLSNLAFMDKDGPSRIGRKLENGKLVRYAKKSGEVIK